MNHQTKMPYSIALWRTAYINMYMPHFASDNPGLSLFSSALDERSLEGLRPGFSWNRRIVKVFVCVTVCVDIYYIIIYIYLPNLRFWVCQENCRFVENNRVLSNKACGCWKLVSNYGQITDFTHENMSKRKNYIFLSWIIQNTYF